MGDKKFCLGVGSSTWVPLVGSSYTVGLEKIYIYLKGCSCENLNLPNTLSFSVHNFVFEKKKKKKKSLQRKEHTRMRLVQMAVKKSW